MIRAGRRAYTLADLAAKKGLSLGTFKNRKLHKAADHPPPISSPKAQPHLWDAEQIDAHYADKPVPELDEADSPDDLLDKYESAAEVGVTVGTWERYTSGTLPGIPPTPKPVKVHKAAQIEHWRRRDLAKWTAQRPGYGSGGGRPAGTRTDARTITDLSPEDFLPPRHPDAAELLADKPDLDATEAAHRLDVAPDSARRALRAARARALAELLADKPDLDVTEAANRLGCTARQAKTPLEIVAAWQRAAEAQPYLARVQAELEHSGLTVTYGTVRARPDRTVAAVLDVREDGGPVRHLVWDERYGWRTAPSTPDLHRGEPTPPTGPGVRYLGAGSDRYPDAGLIRRQLNDGRAGRRRPQP
ncbi:DUF6292 family protein [Streptomyces sp. 891-h]|uniref:DUF6292 family protein n=1 Tax=Streptomyces sp. 891-h TaxID=2720714 RepID=UPI001FA9D2AA|nr:DUF6292 family protein [Streptomyces sp. 891-h]UNZ22323.1 hypothetical protein HC362_34725 [Streptomyces sp. 891-h]